MRRIDKVLVPTDFSPGAEPALQRGVDVARQFDAELHLLHVALLAESSPMYPLFHVTSDVEPMYAKVHEQALSRLAELRDRVELPGRVRAVVKHANAVAPMITRYAADEGVGLIAIGSHGWRGVRRFLLGSVAEEVVREAHCPVMTFRASDDEPQRRPQRILAAVDFSDHSREVIASARELGKLYHARVEFLHVVPRREMPHFYEAGHGKEMLSNFPEIEGVVLSELQAAVQKVGAEDFDLGYRVAHGHPWQEILDLAERDQADLIVIGARGYDQMPPIRLGSTAERVVRGALCPVLAVRREEEGRREEKGPVALATTEESERSSG